MAYIRVDMSYTVKNGTNVSFKAPCDCNAVAGLKVYFPNDMGLATNQVFLFTDAHGNNLTGIGHLFAAGAIVKVILNVDDGKAYIQNADTNAYLEAKLEEVKEMVKNAAGKAHAETHKPTGTDPLSPADIGALAEADPFLWRTVNIVPLTDIDNYQSISAGTTKEIALTVPIDLRKYQYQIDIEVLGLQEYGNTNTKVNDAANFYLVNQSGVMCKDDFCGIGNTCDETDRERHLFWPHKVDCKILTDAQNNFFYTQKGTALGEPLDEECRSTIELADAVYPAVAVQFSNVYPTETYGILLHYRAYKAK